MTASDDFDQPLRVAIVGSGPAGLYAAGHLLAANVAIEVDVFEKLATPWGLVRYGVAPDHQKIKSVTRVFEKTAAQERFRFLGNVEVGVDVTHQELATAYHAVLYAVGAAVDRRLGIPGEDLPGSHAATDFVAWYNGHPDYADQPFDLDARRVVVVGNGNVALDVARMLALDVSELRLTDTADHALKAWSRSAVEEIVVLGRRGPAQAAYTTPELRELAELADADVVVKPSEAELDPASRAFVDSGEADATVRRNVEIIRDYALRVPQRRRKQIVLRFGVSPIEIVGGSRVEGVRVVRNELVLDEHGRIVARSTELTERIDAQLVFRSIGYRSSSVPGVPFDEGNARIHHRDGRVTYAGTEQTLPGVYAAGWVKRGPSGVIGTNKRCAQETVGALLEDLAAGLLPKPSISPARLIADLERRGVEIIDYAGWKRIDAHERSLGEEHGRPRVKLVRHFEHLSHAAKSKVGNY